MKNELQPAWVCLGMLLILLTAIPAGAWGQSCSNDDPDVTLTFTDLGLGTVQIFYLSDFDPSDVSHHPLLFSFSVTNQGGAIRTLRLGFEVHSESDQLLDGMTESFPVAPSETKTGTNQQLSDETSEFELDSFDISSAGEELEDTILEIGYLPEGEYTFILTLTDVALATEISRCEFTITVTNPRTIDLIFPGSWFGGDLPPEASPLPQFQWQSRASRFNFRLCPVLPGDASGDEVMENEPVYASLDFATGFVGTHTFLYPPSAEELVDGQGYCWQVEAIVPTSSGDVLFYSDILCFEFGTAAGGGSLDRILNLLQLGLPPGRLAQILEQLEGLEPTGYVTIDGIQVSLEDLEQLLEILLAEGWEVGDVEIE